MFYSSFSTFARLIGASLFTGVLIVGCGTADTPADAGSIEDAVADAGLEEDAGIEVVDAGPEALSWENFAGSFFQTYCISCHSPAGQAQADFNFSEVVTEGGRPNAIRCGTAPVQQANCANEHPPAWFPVGNGPKPTDDERWSLIQWIEEGCVVNGVQECID